jgi:hypothetical protein
MKRKATSDATRGSFIAMLGGLLRSHLAVAATDQMFLAPQSVDSSVKQPMLQVRKKLSQASIV